MANIIEVLEEDHEEILNRLKEFEILLSGGEIDKKQIKSFLDFDEKFINLHHKREKDILYPKLLEVYPFAREEGIEDALLECRVKDHYIEKIKEAIKNGSDVSLKQSSLFVIGLLRDRIHKEKNTIFVLANKFLSDDDKDDLKNNL